MRCLVLSCVLGIAITACGGDGGHNTPPPDADTGLPACTGVVYDSCADVTNSSDCMAGLSCHYYAQDGLTVCVPTCDATNPCPTDVNGTPGECNNRGICKPTAPNACRP